jgi:hypothetical protein
MISGYRDGKDRWDDEGSHSILVDLIYLSALAPTLEKLTQPSAAN